VLGGGKRAGITRIRLNMGWYGRELVVGSHDGVLAALAWRGLDLSKTRGGVVGR